MPPQLLGFFSERRELMGMGGVGKKKIGLNVEVDRILEIACIVTDTQLTKILEGPDVVIHQSQACIDGFDEWNQEHHISSGLINEVLKSNYTEEDAKKMIIGFIENNVKCKKPRLAGNSVYVDLQYLKKYMPKLADLFSHVLIDVSTVSSLYRMWHPRGPKSVLSSDEKIEALKKQNKHRALSDIRESIRQQEY